MSIADKLITIADNTPAVAEAVDSSRHSVGLGGGGVIRADNVHSDEQNLKCYAEAGVLVSIYGKNFIKTPSVDAEADKNKVLFQGSITGNFVFSCLFNYTECKTPNAAQFEFTVDGAVQYMARGAADSMSKKISGTLTKIRYLNWGYGVGTVDNIQLEEGSAVTEYEQFVGAGFMLSQDGYKYIPWSNPTITLAAENGYCSVSYFPTDSETYAKYKQLKAAQVALAESIKEG